MPLVERIAFAVAYLGMFFIALPVAVHAFVYHPPRAGWRILLAVVWPLGILAWMWRRVG